MRPVGEGQRGLLSLYMLRWEGCHHPSDQALFSQGVLWGPQSPPGLLCPTCSLSSTQHGLPAHAAYSTPPTRVTSSLRPVALLLPAVPRAAFPSSGMLTLPSPFFWTIPLFLQAAVSITSSCSFPDCSKSQSLLCALSQLRNVPSQCLPHLSLALRLFSCQAAWFRSKDLLPHIQP